MDINSTNTEWAWPWWSVIVAISLINLIICAIVYRRSVNDASGGDQVYRRRMRIMGVIFTLVGAYRAVFVSRYFTQMAWFDSIANSSLLIRIFAIAAELSFSGLFVLGMLQLEKDLPPDRVTDTNRFKLFLTKKSPYVLWASIFLAQFFATGGLIMKSKLLFAIEETLWTFGFLSVLPLAIMQLRRVYALRNRESVARLRLLRQFTVITLLWCVFYCSYGLFYHLPFENWAGAMDQITSGLPEIKTGTSAIVDAFTIVYESKEYGDWGFGFLLWHSAYFTVCVWISLFLMQAPRILHRND